MRAAAVLLLLPFALPAAPPPPAFRLPATVRPLAYRLQLSIAPSQPRYSGSIEIDIETRSAASIIWLNSKDIQVADAAVQSASARQPATVIASSDEFLGLELPTPLAPGTYTISLVFSAALPHDRNSGVFRRSHGPAWYVFTAFTPIEARRTFPCFDQPEFKTPWRVTLNVPSGDVALFNTRAIAEHPQPGGIKSIEFAETPPLPSELIAFAVGPFDIVDDGTAGQRNIPVRIITPRGRAPEAAGALGSTRRILAQLEDYTGIPYPWDKLDHLALLDMPFGAIENPGLITYRDRTLLAPAPLDTPEHRRALRGTMAHELAHQWFGNLVTQRWWDDVWLSEGFATWLGTKISDLELPDFERGLAAVEGRGRIMPADNRPVRLPMNSRTDMEQVYSPIVYSKAAAVIQMVEHWLGEEPFRRGLRRYLRDHASAAAETRDLAAALLAETGIDAAPVLASYLDRPGFPTFNAAADCSNSRIRLWQDPKLPWNTPVCIGRTCTLVTGPSATIEALQCPAWPNAGGFGYYRLSSLPPDWRGLTAPGRLAAVLDLAAMPPAQQEKALPALQRDREPRVAAAAERIARQLCKCAGPPADKAR